VVVVVDVVVVVGTVISTMFEPLGKLLATGTTQ
jgi:hypothetical protein